MTKDELEIKKFELEQRVRLEELDLKKKEMDLKMQEQKTKRVSTPLILSIAGGLITLLTGITLNHFDDKSKMNLEDKKFQSSLLLKATDAETYEEFSDMIIAFQQNGLLSLDEANIRSLRKKRFVSEKKVDTIGEIGAIIDPSNRVLSKYKATPWTIIASIDNNLSNARKKQAKAKEMGFEVSEIWHKNYSYKTCIGTYNTRNNALADLFEAKETLNSSAKIVNMASLCPNAKWDSKKKIYTCD